MKKLLFLMIILCLLSVLLIGCTVGGEEVEPIITQINVDGFGNNIFYQFDDLNLENVKLILTYKNGKTSSIPALHDMVSGFNTQNIGKQTITFTYKGLSTKVDIDIKEASAVGIEITKKPDILEFIQGATNLNLNGVVLSIFYNNDRQIDLPPITMQMISGYDPQKIGKQTININYDKFSTNLDIFIVEKNIVSISVAQKPSITTYYMAQNGKIDNTGLILELVYDNKEKVLVDYAKLSEMFSEEELKFVYDLSQPSNKTYVNINLKLNEKILSTRYDIQVLNLVYKSMSIITQPLSRQLTIDGIVQERRNVDNLVEGLEIDWSTGLVEVTLNDDSKVRYSMDSPYISKYNYDAKKIGRVTVKVVFSGNDNYYAPLEINIKAKSGHKVNFLNLHEVLDGNNYYVGTKINLAFLKYQIIYDNGTISEILPYSKDILAPNSTLICEKAGIKTVSFRIAGLTASINVQVGEVLAKMLSVTPPTKNYQKTGILNLNLSGSNYTAILSNNNTVGGILEHNMLTYFYNNSKVDSFSQAGEYDIEVLFLGKKTRFKINIVDNIIREETINITKPLANTKFFLLEFTTMEQWYSEFSKIEFSYTDDSGSIGNSQITSAMIYKFDPYKVGKQSVEFRFMGAIFKYDIEIVALEEAKIGVVKFPQRNFSLNQEFNADGLTIERIFNDNSKDYIYDVANNPNFEISIPDMTTLGKKTIYIKYTTGYNNILRTEYDIEVSDLTIKEVRIDYNPSTEHNNNEYFSEYIYNGVTYNVLKVIKGQPLNLYGIYMTVIYNEVNEYGNNFVAYIPLNNVTNNYEPNVSLSDNLRDVQLDYNGFRTNIKILIEEDTIARIEVTKTPNRKLFAEGQELNFIGGELTVYYQKGNTDTIPLTSHYVILKSYNSNPFIASDKPGAMIDNPVTIEYRGYETIFNVTTIKKMLPTLSYQNIVGFYGEEMRPKIEVTNVPEYFVSPEIHLEYFVNGSWTTGTPRLPGDYALKVTVYENDFYIGSEITGKKLQIIKKLARVTIDVKSKVYGESDPNFSYSISGLVGKDTIGFRLFREDLGEDVKYDPITNAIIGYNINFELIPSFADNINQNEYYYIEFTQSTLTINPIEPTEVYFGNTNFVYDGEVKNVVIEYSSGNVRKTILQKDILYYMILEDGTLELVTEILDSGKYKAVISQNYKITGERERIIIVS